MISSLKTSHPSGLQVNNFNHYEHGLDFADIIDYSTMIILR